MIFRRTKIIIRKNMFSQNCVSEAPPENEYYDRLEIVPNLIYTRHVVFFYIYKCFTIFTRYTDISRKKNEFSPFRQTDVLHIDAKTKEKERNILTHYKIQRKLQLRLLFLCFSFINESIYLLIKNHGTDGL